MPNKPKRPCRYPGCPSFCEQGQVFIYGEFLKGFSFKAIAKKLTEILYSCSSPWMMLRLLSVMGPGL